MVLIGGKKRATNWMNLSQLRRAVWLRRLARREALILLRYQRFLAPHKSGAALKRGTHSGADDAHLLLDAKDGVLTFAISA
jgi:hypothetical protein